MSQEVAYIVYALRERDKVNLVVSSKVLSSNF